MRRRERFFFLYLLVCSTLTLSVGLGSRNEAHVGEARENQPCDAGRAARAGERGGLASDWESLELTQLHGPDQIRWATRRGKVSTDGGRTWAVKRALTRTHGGAGPGSRAPPACCCSGQAYHYHHSPVRWRSSRSSAAAAQLPTATFLMKKKTKKSCRLPRPRRNPGGLI